MAYRPIILDIHLPLWILACFSVICLVRICFYICLQCHCIMLSKKRRLQWAADWLLLWDVVNLRQRRQFPLTTQWTRQLLNGLLGAACTMSFDWLSIHFSHWLGLSAVAASCHSQHGDRSFSHTDKRNYVFADVIYNSDLRLSYTKRQKPSTISLFCRFAVRSAAVWRISIPSPSPIQIALQFHLQPAYTSPKTIL